MPRCEWHVTYPTCAKTASPKPSFGVPWSASNAVDGRQNAGWTTSKEGTSLSIPELLTVASRRKDWKRVSAESSFTSLKRPNRSRDRTELKCHIILKRLYPGRIRPESCSQPLFKNWKLQRLRNLVE